MYYFLRHGKPAVQHETYADIPVSYLSALGKNEVSPGIDTEFSEGIVKRLELQVNFDSITQIYAAPSDRSLETALLVGKHIARDTVTIRAVPKLSEIQFDLIAILPKPTPEFISIPELNNAVFSAIVANQCTENLGEIFERIKSLLDFLTENALGDVICITQDYIMRCIELYLRGIQNPAEITVDTFNATHRNKYLSGFSYDPSKGQITIIDVGNVKA